MAKAGRNESCPCGSGKKFKRCCEAKASGSRAGTIVLVAVGVLLAAIFLFALMDRDRGPGVNRVWSEEHGHYHAP